ncbi:P-loop containing nucleoside triphosphate hydrolase protein [Trametes meyenii]|nr:P-loop containing nucleoside triphosphate hydrolase protein [Trametes meyenii]
MLRIPQLLRTSCRHELRSPALSSPRIFHRSRGWKAASPTKYTPKTAPHKRKFIPVESAAEVPRLKLSAEDVPSHFAQKAPIWYSRSNDLITDRLIRFGIPEEYVRPLLKVFVAKIVEGEVFRDLEYRQEQLARIAYDVSEVSPQPFDQHCTKILFEWVSHPAGQQVLEDVIPPDVISRMQALFHAADLSAVSWEYTFTRKSRPRKFIMHVGPTNSGKTHNALRALAAAKRGIYAGPLRLLAYEIYDRLNKGQIVPLGVEPDPEVEPDSQSNIDVGETGITGKNVVVTKSGNPKYARPCNMMTGEEQKIVQDNAPLLSCTVEMAPHGDLWDVAVIDEIQLISDRNRGGAWTAAVLGLNAAEIHLCGEESAIPVVEAIVRELGDTMEINRYERLTPLVVADQSLQGGLQGIQKGDCVVSFSRTGIFGLKSEIEKETKMRCALAYGRLPPEIRSEQAVLFNDPDSDYNVLVGSDAIGMGLNLKIKRIVFEAVSKFDGGRPRVLSASQIKQIAGRAGRFGLHGDNSQGGIVTTLRPEDLEIVRKALKSPYDTIRYARLPMDVRVFTRIMQVLPQGASQLTAADVFVYVSKVDPRFEVLAIHDLKTCMEFIDQYSECLTVEGRLLVQNSPCPWRDEYSVAGAAALMDVHRDRLQVPIEDLLQRAGLLRKLNTVLVLMEDDTVPLRPPQVTAYLNQLETVHKVIVMYLWYSYRYSVAFPDQEKAFELRQLTEVAMDWCLEVHHQIRISSKSPGATARREVLQRRRLDWSQTGNIAVPQKRVTKPKRHEIHMNIVVR